MGKFPASAPEALAWEGVQFVPSGLGAHDVRLANIHAKQERIASGSGEHMNKSGSKQAPSVKDFKNAAKTEKKTLAKVSK